MDHIVDIVHVSNTNYRSPAGCTEYNVGALLDMCPYLRELTEAYHRRVCKYYPGIDKECLSSMFADGTVHRSIQSAYNRMLNHMVEVAKANRF
jgi:hypothetical protein